MQPHEFVDILKDKFDLSLEKKDQIACLVIVSITQEVWQKLVKIAILIFINNYCKEYSVKLYKGQY